MATLHEGRHTAEFILSMANRNRSLENRILATGNAVVPGEVLGRLIAGAIAQGDADAGNTGDGTIGTLSVGDGAIEGAYRAVCVESETDAGAFIVEDPEGRQIGTATVGQAFDTQIGFTISDGATDFAAGDAFTITVSGADGEFAPFDPSGVDGSQAAVAIAYAAADATDADADLVTVERDAEVIAASLVWPDDITDDQKTAALASLAEAGIIAR